MPGTLSLASKLHEERKEAKSSDGTTELIKFIEEDPGETMKPGVKQEELAANIACMDLHISAILQSIDLVDKVPNMIPISGGCDEYDNQPDRIIATEIAFVDLHMSAIFFARNAMDDRPFIKVEVEETEAEALLDSGANCTAIGQELANLINWEECPKRYGPYRIKMADDSPYHFDYLFELQYKFMGKTHMIPTAILPQLGADAILGMNFWKAYGITPAINTIEMEEIESYSPVRGEHKLTDDQKSRLDEAVSELPFSTDDYIGKTHLLKHSIETGDAQPFRRKAYVISPYMEEMVNAEIDRMLKLDVIEPSDSPWNNAMVTAKKANGKLRYCIDAKQLNLVTKRDAYPLPNLNRILSRLTKTKFLTSIDLKDAFWQVELEEKDRIKTAFTVTGRGFFHFKRMPFGLVNSAATLCKLVDRIAGEDLEPKVFRYLDDFIIATNDFDEHLAMIRELAKRLKTARLTISREKSKFCMKELTYVGYLINEQGCRTDPEKISAVIDYPAPKTIKEVRRFFGMASWYRRFINGFAGIAAPITELVKVKNNKQFVWTEKAQQAFEELKRCLTTAPVLAMPRYDSEWILETDASDVGMGGCLKQVQDGEEKVIVYFSKKLSKAQQKYTVTERECLAVITFIEKARPYIEGVHSFTVITDHSSLRWLHNLKDPQGRLARWALRMQAHNYKIEHRPGSKMIVADALSRAICLVEIKQEDRSSDPGYMELMNEIIDCPAKHPMYGIHFENLYKRNNAGTEEFGGTWKLVVPGALRKTVLFECHDSELAAHGGIFKTLYRVRQDYYWPGMKKDIISYVGNCITCKSTKSRNTNQRAYMGKERSPRKKFQMVCLDYIGPLVTSSKGNNWLLVIIDNFTKYVIAQTMRKATAEKTIEILENHLITKFGCPETILLDNGSQFRSRLFKDYAAKKRITLWPTPNYHPQANPTEAANKTIGNAIRAYIQDRKSHKKWDNDLQSLICAMNSSIHTSIQMTPHMAVFGENIALSGNDHRMRIIDEEEGDAPSTVKFQRIRDHIIHALEESYLQRAHRYNLRARKIDYKVGEVVFKKNFKLSNAANDFMAKLDDQYEYVRIHEKVGNNCYRLVDTNGKILQGTYSTKDLKA